MGRARMGNAHLVECGILGDRTEGQTDERFGELQAGRVTSRINDAVISAESQLDPDGLLHRIREAVAKAGSTIDTDAIVGRFEEVAGQAEGKIDTGRLRQGVVQFDRNKLKAWLAEAQHLGVGAVSVLGTQGGKLAGRAPGTIDQLAGAATERLCSLTGDERLIGEGQIERLKGQFKETITSVSEMTENRSKDVAEAIKTKLGEEAGRADR